jgi:hypothetical protein
MPRVTSECRPAGAECNTIAAIIMDSWIKLVALFLLVFTLYDVSVPETCLDEGLAFAASSTQVQASHQDGDRGGCQFEEDCLACAHILPTTCSPLPRWSRLPNPIHSCPPNAEFLLFHITLLVRNFLLLLN